jgi:4-hydroxybenzoate polyprenyltransferase
MLCYAIFIAILAAVGVWQNYGLMYFAGLASGAVIAASHYGLIRGRSREGCFKAFIGNNWVGAAIFAGILLDNEPWVSLARWLPR